MSLFPKIADCFIERKVFLRLTEKSKYKIFYCNDIQENGYNEGKGRVSFYFEDQVIHLPSTSFFNYSYRTIDDSDSRPDYKKEYEEMVEYLNEHRNRLVVA